VQKTICNFLVVAALMLNCIATIAQPGDPDPFGSDDVLASSTTPSTPSAFSSTADFLPVEQAYQLIPQLDGTTLHLTWQIADGYYLYQDRFHLTDPNGQITLSDPVYSNRGQVRYDDYYEKNLEVFYQSIRITYNNLPVNQAFTLTAKSQGCADAGLCYPPRAQQLRIDTVSGQVDVSEALPPEKPSPQPASTDWPLTVLMIGFAILGGAILNLMPCVFPVLSIKVLSFASAHHSAHGKHLHGLAYAVGTTSTFVGIALLLMFLRSTGELIGWGFQLQSPAFVSYLAYLFFTMALSFSGMADFGSSLMGIGQNRTTEGGVQASFMSGVLATVVASPCTAPFMGSALGFAMTQPAAVGLLIFAGLGLGMALPLLMLSWMPGLADRMPRPGPWMETFKQLLAFPLYLTVVWLIWLLGRQVDSDYVALLCSGMVILAFGLWLWQRRAGERHMPTRIAAIFVIVAALLIPQWGSSIHRESGVQWQTYDEVLLKDLRTRGKPVFVNLSADWCITCLANEKVALSSKEVHETFDRLGITYLKGDWTNSDPEITRLLIRYQRSGVPLYLLYPPGTGDAVILPQLLTESLVLDSIEQVWRK